MFFHFGRKGGESSDESSRAPLPSSVGLRDPSHEDYQRLAVMLDRSDNKITAGANQLFESLHKARITLECRAEVIMTAQQERAANDGTSKVLPTPSEELEIDHIRRKLGVIQELQTLQGNVSSIAYSDYDQIVGMLKIARKGHILFSEGVRRLEEDGELSKQGKAVLDCIKKLHEHIGVSIAQANQDPSFTIIGKSAARNSQEPLQLSKSEGKNPNEAFASEVCLLIRVLHPLGKAPFLSVPGRNAMGFRSSKSFISLTPEDLLEIRSSQNGMTTATLYGRTLRQADSHGADPRSAVADIEEGRLKQVEQLQILPGNQLLLGRRLVFGPRVLGVEIPDRIEICPDMHLKSPSASRLAYQVVIDWKGRSYPFDRAARSSFGLSEVLIDGVEQYRYDPQATLRNDGRFTSGGTQRL